MNIETGRITNDPSEIKKLIASSMGIPVKPEDMTREQRAKGRVSLADHRSKLGRLLTAERAAKGLTKNLRRKLKRRGILR